MRALPLTARLYLIVTWTAAAVLIGAALISSPGLIERVDLLLLWLLLFGYADYFEVEFEIGDGDRLRMTVTDAALIFLVTASGLSGVLVIAIGTCIVEALRRRPWYRNLFNASQRSITYLAILQVYTLLHTPGTTPFSGPGGLASLVAITGVYYLLNTLFVGTIFGLAQGQPLLRVYRDSFLAARWVYLVIMPVGVSLAALWDTNPWLLIPGVVPLIMAHRSFRAVAAWQAESRRNKALARESQQLASKLERLQDTATAMIASFEPGPLLKTVSTRLAALLEASASWVVLLEQTRVYLVAASGIPPTLTCDAGAYAAELESSGVRQLDATGAARLHGMAQSPWQTLVIIPLAVENRVLGGICLALDHQITLAEDDRRVLLAFAAQAALAMEHARLFEELRHKQDELVRSSKLAALGSFSAGIAHEFNNLLAGILGYAELGLSSDNQEEKDEALQVAVRSCLRGRSITGGLLTFARRDDPQRGLHQVREAVEDMLALVERELAKLNIRVERRFQIVPPTVCDPGQISQVILNLVTNARDAMLEKGGGVITIDLARYDDQIELAVSDTGTGIPDHLLEHVFQPFMTTKGALGGSATPGTGLGLAISYGIVQSHGGTITIDSQVGVGTTVTIRLPIVKDTMAIGEQDLHLAPLKPLRILVVDDDEVVANSVARLLESHEHNVNLVPDGETALRRYREEPFDLVISDIVMPGMDGIELLHRLRMLDSHAQVLIMTGHAVSSQVDQMLRAGALGVISKPFIVDELLSIVARSGQTRMLHAA